MSVCLYSAVSMVRKLNQKWGIMEHELTVFQNNDSEELNLSNKKAMVRFWRGEAEGEAEGVGAKLETDVD